jgi:xanthine dehydrogenase accessory factor
MIEIFKSLEERIISNKPCVLVTIIEMKGSTPGKVGFKMLVGPEGRITGTVGGGGVEYHAVDKAKEMLSKDENSLVETLLMKDSILNEKENYIEMKKDDRIEINALCGGEVTLFYEVYKSSKIIYIFGAGHVAQAVANLAKNLNYHVIILDCRQNVLDELDANLYNQKYLIDLPNLNLKEKDYLTLDVNGFAVILTHNHTNDLQVLEFIYKNYSAMKYIGMIGSNRKVKEGIEFIKKRFSKKLDFQNLYSPIGADIGGNSPAEIALSIMAEIQALTYGKNINHLRLNYDVIK